MVLDGFRVERYGMNGLEKMYSTILEEKIDIDLNIFFIFISFAILETVFLCKWKTETVLSVGCCAVAANEAGASASTQPRIGGMMKR